MKKKRIILALSFATICGGVWAQEQSPLLWPIKGQEAGTNILLRPQDLLDHETNYGKLVIGATDCLPLLKSLSRLSRHPFSHASRPTRILTSSSRASTSAIPHYATSFQLNARLNSYAKARLDWTPRRYTSPRFTI